MVHTRDFGHFIRVTSVLGRTYEWNEKVERMRRQVNRTPLVEVHAIRVVVLDVRVGQRQKTSRVNEPGSRSECRMHDRQPGSRRRTQEVERVGLVRGHLHIVPSAPPLAERGESDCEVVVEASHPDRVNDLRGARS